MYKYIYIISFYMYALYTQLFCDLKAYLNTEKNISCCNLYCVRQRNVGETDA
jgi:hypothetical protein